MFWVITSAVIFVLGWYTPVLAQELYALSTDTGLEFYQVEAVKKLDLKVNRSKSALWPTNGSSIGRNGLNSGFQTTVNGRILTMAGRIDWQPTQFDVKLVEELNGDSEKSTNQQVAWEKNLSLSLTPFK